MLDGNGNIIEAATKSTVDELKEQLQKLGELDVTIAKLEHEAFQLKKEKWTLEDKFRQKVQ